MNLNKTLKLLKLFLSSLLLFALIFPFENIFASTLDSNSKDFNNTNNLTTISYSEEDYIASKQSNYKEISKQTFKQNMSLFNSLTYNLNNEYELKQYIYSELKKRKTKIDISRFCTSLTPNDADYIFNAYFDTLYEYPDIFYTTEYVSFTYLTDSNNFISFCELQITYPYDQETLNKIINDFSLKVEEINDLYLKDISNPLELEYEIYDYIINNTIYDYENLQSNTVPYISHTAYGSLINGVAVCDGYSKAAKVLFNLVGIDSGIIVSPEMNHAWNYVKFDNQYYHLDITWADPSFDTGKHNYNYFNLSDEEMRKDHIWPNTYPSFTSDKFSFLREDIGYKAFRLKDKIYYINYENKIKSISISGDASEVILENTPSNDIIGYNNTLYIALGNEIKSFNLSSKKLTSFENTTSFINNLDILNGVLYAKTYDSGNFEFDLKIPEDINCDGIVDILDLSTLGLKYNVKSTDSIWRRRFDINKDGIIDLFDIVFLAKKL